MKNLICYLFIYLYLATRVTSLAQSISAQRRIDSLDRLYQDARIDTTKIVLLKELAWEHYVGTDFEKAKLYLKTQRQLLDNLQESKYKIWKNNHLAENYTINGSLILERTGNYDSVFQKYKIAQQILEQYPESHYSIYMANVLSNMGYAYNKQGKSLHALNYQLKAIQIDTLLTPMPKMYLAHLAEVGDLYALMGNKEQALAYYLKSLENAQKMQDTRYTYVSYGKLGDIYAALGRYPEAIEYVQLAITGATTFQRSLDVARFQSQLGGIYALEGDYKKAIYLFLFTLRAYERARLTTTTGMTGIMNRLARMYQKIGRYDSAQFYLDKAFGIQQKMKYYEGIPITLLNFAECYQTQNQYKKARKYYQMALDSSLKKYNVTNLQRAYTGLVKVNEGLRNFEDAFYFQKLANQLKDSISKVQNDNKLAEMQIKFETQAKEYQIKQLNIENELKNKEIREDKIILGLTISVFTLLLCFSFFIYRYRLRYQNKLKNIEAKHQMQMEKERISKDLHDNIGSQMSLISRKLDYMLMQDVNNEDISNLSTSTHDILSQLRQTLWAINKESIKIIELENKIITLVYQCQKLHEHIHISFQSNLSTQENLVFSVLEGLSFFRITQEALHNALKHSQAQEIKITLILAKQNVLTLKIEDNGIGFSKENASKSESYGLQNMQSRAAGIGATILIESQTNKGTSITVSK
jgi:signal transduction histidine kinase